MTELPPRTESELVELVRSADVRAPEALHTRVESLIADHRSARGRGFSGAPGARARPFASRKLAGAIAAAAAAGAIVAALTGGQDASRTLSLSQAFALTLRPATVAAPRESHTRREQLAAAVDGIAFPYWGGGLGWRSTGARTDRVGGRAVTTVFYANSRGQRIGYAIVAGLPAPSATGGTISWRGGVPYRLLREHGVSVVTWQRNGRLCVLSGRSVRGATLLRLASWDDGRAIAS